MKTIHKVVLALVSSFAHGTSNPAPQGNRALEKMDRWPGTEAGEQLDGLGYEVH